MDRETEKRLDTLIAAQQHTNRLLEALLKVHGVKSQPVSKLAANPVKGGASKTGGGGAV